ncbi:hypothetical protein AB4076_17930 [Dyella sp. 2RAF44]|jgi:hypothetical protein|uniref:hypothetical protein n=1 Tax=Dyella sp. 2RAF44 TaxID=3233000 RepID=UPI003F8F09B2
MRSIRATEFENISGGSTADGNIGTARYINGKLVLPDACSTANLVSNVQAGAITGGIGGAIAGAASGPGAILSAAGGAVLGAGLGAMTASINCRNALSVR